MELPTLIVLIVASAGIGSLVTSVFMTIRKGNR